jgi:hypothetical protein
MKGYPAWFRPALIAVSLIVYVSGCLLAPSTLAMRAEWERGWSMASGPRQAMTAAHAATAFGLLLFIGALWAVHMRSGWRRRRQRISGLVMALGFCALIVTAVGVYYAGDQAWADAAGIGHLLLGLPLLVPFVWHAVRGWRHRRQHRR